MKHKFDPVESDWIWYEHGFDVVETVGKDIADVKKDLAQLKPIRQQDYFYSLSRRIGVKKAKEFAASIGYRFLG